MLVVFATGFWRPVEHDEEEVREKAGSVDRLEDYYSNPCVSRPLSLREREGRVAVVRPRRPRGPYRLPDRRGRLGRVEGGSHLDVAGVSRPSLSDEEAIKLAWRRRRCGPSFSEHGPYTTTTEYRRNMDRPVPFYVEEEGLVDGRPTDEGKRSP